ncbi:MAG: ASPIC/UnbV domain-containing protein, partial [Deltaproteobacteria bacterium]|nr:ASPIC/UnbV domain-containing protein [Deltaproteobacteria bacterium]
IVYIEAGGKRQVRLQDLGIRKRSQNGSRIHFGLGKNASIDELTIHWPSGRKTSLKNIQADQIIKISEKETT